MADGLILLAHGSRDPRWAEPLEGLRARVAASLPQCAVELAYLELMAPDLATAVQGLAARGLRDLAVVPLFLGQGSHIRQHVPLLVREAAAKHPRTALRLAPTIGEAPEVLEAIAAYCARAATGGAQ